MEALFGILFGIFGWILIFRLLKGTKDFVKEYKDMPKEDKDQIKSDMKTGIKDGLKTVAKHPFLYK